ncbi:MAG: DNA starvation/stationary phase protection protein [bacterium]
MKLNIGIADKNLKGAVSVLNQLLADEHVLYMKLRNYHWHVTGPTFSELHKLFESQYDEIEGAIDDIAERTRSLGGNALGTLKEMLQSAKLKETPGNSLKAEKMVTNLLLDHEAIIRQLRVGLETCMDEYGDMGTSDFLTGLMEKHEKMAWMLRACLL